MTREDIIRMAREAGFDSAHLTRFAELVFEQGRQEGMKQERALWTLTKLGQEIEAQPEACQYAVDVAMPEYRCVGKCQYAAPPQRPWVELTGEEMESTCAGTWSYDPYVIARAIADKLKEKNT